MYFSRKWGRHKNWFHEKGMNDKEHRLCVWIKFNLSKNLGETVS